MDYILLIHKNAAHVPPEESLTSDMPSEDIKNGELRNQEQWNDFLAAARGSGIFSGGSAISRGELIGAADVDLLSENLAGHMRFNTDGIADGLEVIHQLLKTHPTVLNGGTVELCEMPPTG